MAVKKFPSVASLKGFEACARHLNFSQAATELHITQSAISHQIKQLEEVLGAELFERSGGAMTLTSQGAELLPVVRSFFKGMTRIVDRFEQIERRELMLEVFAHDSFATTWLLPRLSGFYALWPDIKVRIVTEEFARFESANSQVAIKLAEKQRAWPGLYSEFVLAEQMFPVCSPELVKSLGVPSGPADIIRYPLIIRSRNRLSGESVNSPSWEYWLDKNAVPFEPTNRALTVPYTSMAVLAATRGLGVAMARTSHISDELKTGKLQKLFVDEVDTQSGYYFLCTQGKEKTFEINAFLNWLKEECLTA
jgi:LysR family glycine cleavage system transcriptional activator